MSVKTVRWEELKHLTHKTLRAEAIDHLQSLRSLASEAYDNVLAVAV